VYSGSENGNGYRAPDGEIAYPPIDVDAPLPDDLAPIDTAMVYAPYLNAKLRDRVERFRKAGVSLLGELALTRAVACEAVESYGRAMILAETVTDELKRSAITSAAMAFVQHAIDNVRDMALAAHRVMSKESVDPQVVQSIIFQVVKVFDAEVQREQHRLRAAGIDPQEFVDRLTNTIDENVGVGFSDVQLRLGTELTAEQLNEEVAEMLDSVPRAVKGA
jgi:hypothetical protein